MRMRIQCRRHQNLSQNSTEPKNGKVAQRRISQLTTLKKCNLHYGKGIQQLKASDKFGAYLSFNNKQEVIFDMEGRALYGYKSSNRSYALLSTKQKNEMFIGLGQNQTSFRKVAAVLMSNIKKEISGMKTRN